LKGRKLNNDDVNKNAVGALRKIDTRLPYGTDLFNEILRVTVGVTVEAVILRITPQDKREVFLTRRKAGEAYAGLWHCPGTFLRTGEAIEDAFLRLEEKEQVGKFLTKKFIGFANNLHEERGHIVQLIFSCELESVAIGSGTWFLIDNLPDEMVEDHLKVLIPMVLGSDL